MKKKKLIATGILAAMFCQSVFAPGMAGMVQDISQVQAEAPNVAASKTVTASAVESGTAFTADKVVDGDSQSTDGRWSSGVMRPMSGATEDTEQTPQWVVIDLQAAETQVESMKVYFHAKVWATSYKVQTCDTADGTWEDVYQLQRPSADTQNPVDTINAADMTNAKLKRYVRVYFEKLNLNAAWNCVSVKEIEIRGTQTGAITSAQNVLGQISSLPVAAEDGELKLPAISDQYDVKLYGSEVKQVISDEGKIAPLHIGNRSMNVIVQATSKTTPSDTAKKNITVTVPDNTAQYPELFPTVANPNPEPEVLPTVQEWYGYEGNYELTQDTAIVYNDAANVGLAEVAQEMQDDMKEICGFAPEIKAGTEGDADDIYLESQKEDVYGTGEEGYLLVNGDQGIKIYSSTKTGALYGTVTVEQILYQDDAHKSVPKGVIRDYPLYHVRGVMMDVARIPTRMQMLEDYTKIFKWYKINEFHVHLNDGQWSEPAYSPDYEKWKEVEGAHRLYSDTFPSLALQNAKFMRTGDNEGRYDYYYSTHTGCDGELYYTKDEFKKLQQDGAKRGMDVMPELDTPSHSNAYSKYVYENQEEVIKSLANKGYIDKAQYLNADGSVKSGASFYVHNPNDFELLAINEESSNAQEVTNAKNAKIFMTALFDEYLDEEDPTFLGNVISAGVDEYWQKGTQQQKEAFRKYMNFMKELLVDKYGKEVRMWGSLNQFKGTTEVSKDIIMEVWNVGEDMPLERLNEGYRVINVPQPYLYTTPGRYHKDMIREEYVYENWDPVMFNNSQSADKGDPLFLGAKAALWGDENREGITEADLNERYLRVAAMVSEKTWGGTKADDTFIEYEQTFDRLREGPGTKIANEIKSETDQVLNYDFADTSADNTIVYDQSGNGYDGKITGGTVQEMDGETWLKFDGNTTVETPLTTLGYPYTMSFDVYLDGTEQNDKESSLFSGYDGRLQLAGMAGSLSLNRDYFTQSFDYPVPTKEKHRISIVGTYQVTKLYVDGVFKKILYAAASDPDNGGDIGKSTWTDADNNFRTTFVFPLNVIGKGFSGYLGNIAAYNKALSTEEFAAEGLTGEVDVARNRHAYTDLANSSFWGDQMRLYPAWKATDGDGHVTGASGVSTSNESRWNSSDNDKDFLMIDLGREREISKVVIDWEASRYGASYDIQTSMDGKQWNTAKSVTGNTSALTTDTFAPVKARYVKMQGVKRKSNEYCIYEMKAYENVDKTALNEACKDAKAYMEAKGITRESTAAAFVQTYLTAKTVVNNVMAGQEEVNEALEALKTEEAKWDTALPQISQALAKAETLLKDKDQYEAASFENFNQAYQAVKTAPAGISPEEYQSLLKNLETAQNALVKKAPETEKPSPQDNVKVVQLSAPAVQNVKSQPTGVKVTWQGSAHAEAYQLYRKAGSTAVKVGEPVKGTTAYDQAPVGGKNVSYYVVALSGTQKGYKDSAAGTAKSIKLPKATAKLTASQTKGKKEVTLKWKKVKKAASYMVYRSEGKSGKWKKLAVVKAKKGTNYRDKKVKKGKSYSYKVITVAGKKYSPAKAAKKSVKIK